MIFLPLTSTDRGNIGNSKVLNEETGDDLLQQTNMTADGYALTVTLFSLAYALFEVPSNWVMKHYVRPSLWLAFLLFAWGALTIGFAGVQNYATVVSLRFFIGAFEAGFFPGMSSPQFPAPPNIADSLGIVYFITIWYRWNERAVRIALVTAFCNLAGVSCPVRFELWSDHPKRPKAEHMRPNSEDSQLHPCQHFSDLYAGLWRSHCLRGG